MRRFRVFFLVATNVLQGLQMSGGFNIGGRSFALPRDRLLQDTFGVLVRETRVVEPLRVRI